jgi:hypothetical protein
MAKNGNNAHAYNNPAYAVWTAPLNTAGPTDLTTPVPNFYEVGLLDDSGITENRSVNDNLVYDMSGALVRDIRNQEQRQFTFSALERNAVTFGLMYSNSALTTAGGTASVQTATISGTPTGGTFTLFLNGVSSGAQPYNVTAAALQTALRAAWGIAVTVTLSSNVYTITFPVAEGAASQITATAAFTGGTTPSVATAITTPGVQGVNTRTVGSGTAANRRAFVVDTVDGSLKQRFVINNGEAVQSGAVSYTGSGLAVYQFQLSTYLDSNNLYYSIIDNDSAMGQSFA